MPIAVPLGGLLGLLIGSFLNVVAHRLPRGESVVSPPSRCPGCETEIAPWDNVPVVSWLLLRGRCRSCGEPISARYPVVEAITGIAFALVVVVRGADWDLAYELPFVALLVAISAIDLDHRIIPNRLVLPGAVWALATAAAIRPGDLPELAAAGAGAFTLLLLAALARPGGMGMGDVKLAGMMGLYLGAAVAPALLVAFLAGALVGVAMMAREGLDARKRGVPFGPFLALGAIVGLLAGAELIDLYTENLL